MPASPSRRRVATLLLLVLAALVPASCGRSDALRRAGDECAPGRSLAMGTSRHVLDHDGIERTYLVHVPPGYDGSSRVPVVYLFHGLGGEPEVMVQTTRMAELADEEGFIVVTPQGLGALPRWDFRTPASTPGSDHAFVDALVQEVEQTACVDTNREYAAGFSNGSAMTLALACRPDSPFAAYGAVSAPWFVPSCEAAPPASVVYFHGLRDKVVPYDGADTLIGRVPSVDDAVTRWARHDRCPPRRATTSVSQNVRHFSWTGCRDGSAVELYAVENGGHRWPGGAASSPGRTDGIQTQEIDASRLIWDFFTAHPRGGQ
jgi:polyhydroxybutyrate depolymerase